MKINFTKKEFEVLLNVVYMADWVIDAHQEGDNDETKQYRDLEQKIFSYAKEFGLEKYVQWEAKFQNFFPTRELEDGNAREFIEQFEDDTFWDELTDRLAKRDFIRKYGEEAISKMDVRERFEKFDEFEEKYLLEFEENGIENIKI